MNHNEFPWFKTAMAVAAGLKRQDKLAVLGLVLRTVAFLKTRPPDGDLWIVEPDRIRFRAQ